MTKFSFTDLKGLEKYPTSPAGLKNKFHDVLYNSTNCRWKVESCNHTTGEYRVVLTGTLDCCGDDFGGGNQG